MSDLAVVGFPHFSTEAIHAGQDPAQWKSQAVVPPICVSTTFELEKPSGDTQVRCVYTAHKNN